MAPDGTVIGEGVVGRLPSVILAIGHIQLAVQKLPRAGTPDRRAERGHCTRGKTGAIDLGSQVVHGRVDLVFK